MPEENRKKTDTRPVRSMIESFRERPILWLVGIAITAAAVGLRSTSGGKSNGEFHESIELPKDGPVGRTSAATVGKSTVGSNPPPLDSTPGAIKELHEWHRGIGFATIAVTLFLGWIGYQDYGIHKAEAQIAESQKAMAQDNLIFNVNKGFEEFLDPQFRRRFYRLCFFMESNNIPTNQISQFNQFVADLDYEKNIVLADTNILTNSILAQLIQPDLDLDFSDDASHPKAAEIQSELATYHMVLLRDLNLLEMLDVLYTNTPDEPYADEVFWWFTVTNRAYQLRSFLADHQKINPAGFRALRGTLTLTNSPDKKVGDIILMDDMDPAPDGFLKCDNQRIYRSQFPQYFEAIGSSEESIRLPRLYTKSGKAYFVKIQP